ncbi:uncharacterized protein LOC118750280 isoform X2 [Rhagoletis pomonella]|uniref:uncharacterized protein LOC118750280 isoform X2 n=1 Tax=Rhagoletis pomonella TaxID=28610 RepID=UPI001782A149|nr:uncharacterized protein LOC118750280 isoform X2 [Rhagoletis pomonella]
MHCSRPSSANISLVQRGKRTTITSATERTHHNSFCRFAENCKAPLTAHLQPQVQTVDVDKDAQFQCIVSGHPVHDVNWLHDGKPILRDNRVEVKNVWAGCMGVRRYGLGMLSTHGGIQLRY